VKYPRGRWSPCVLPAIALLALLDAAPAAGQSPADGAWNAPRAEELVRKAQARRGEQRFDATLQSYAADGRALVQFFLDERESGRQELVRTDQVAVELFWGAPDRVKQRIVGMRQRDDLPTRNLRYYSDRLTAVMDNLGDAIVIADGENVRDVPHPLAPAALELYDFQLADSVVIRLAGVPEPIHAYRLRVRPKDPSQPAVVGSLLVDGASGDLVRLDVTFTRAAYVERWLDRISVSLENALWAGRYWLPHEQRLEIRREIPELDLPVGTVIRTRMRVGNYRFNEPLPPALFLGPRIVHLPPDALAGFAFEESIEEAIEDEVARVRGTAGGDRAALEAEMRALLRREGFRASGLPSSRLQLRAVSELLRYNRAEGWVVGAGASLATFPGARLRGRGEWAFGAGRAQGELALSTLERGAGVVARGYAHELRDLGPLPALPGAVNSLSARLLGEDLTDPYHATGAALHLHRRPVPEWALAVGVRAERHASAAEHSSAWGGRPVFAIDEGALGMVDAELTRAPAAGPQTASVLRLRLEGGTLAGDAERRSFLRGIATSSATRRIHASGAELEVEGLAGAALGRLPRQNTFFLGGPGTLPGYGFRTFGGDRFALARATVAADLAAPWVRARAFAAAGWSGAGEQTGASLAAMGSAPTGAPRASAGVGLGLLHDVVRLYVARGFGAEARWQLELRVASPFREML
jgi:hypothetical protein